MSADGSNLSRRDLARLGAGMAVAAPALAAGPAEARAAGKKPSRVPVEDRLDIIELMARYAWAYDTNNVPDLLATFTADGTMYAFGDPVGGRDKIAEMIAGNAERRGTAGWQHLTDHHVFRDYTGDRCTVYSFYTMMEGDAAGANGRVRAMGYYTSYCRKENGEWLFARRDVTRWNGKRPW